MLLGSSGALKKEGIREVRLTEVERVKLIGVLHFSEMGTSEECRNRSV